jgi:GT2 family glycosyltransferase
VGLLSPAFDGSQDYDLVLRASEKARRITHIPTVLYHWRAIGTSIASNPDAKPEAHTAAAKAVSDHLSRLEIEAEVGLHKQNSYVTVKRVLRKNPRTSILIPSCGSRANIHGEDVVLVENCVESILSLSTYSNYEIIVILDDFCPESTRNLLHERDPERLKVVEFNGEFNFSAKVNLGAVKASGEILIPLNDDTKVVTNTWIEELLVYLEDDDVGISAPLLLLENGSIQSAGHFFRHGAHHFAPGLPVGTLGYGGLLTFPAERSGITFACAAIKRSVYEEVGGLSEKFPRSFNDVDFCNKVRKFGYRIIWTPQSVLYHFESLTRDPKVHFSEVEQLYGRWGHLLSMPDEYLADVS